MKTKSLGREHDAIMAAGKLFIVCEDCGRLVCMTGVFRGWHLCLTDAELAERRAQRGERVDLDASRQELRSSA